MILKISFAPVSMNSSNVLCASCLFPLPVLHLSLTVIPTDPFHVFMWVPTCSLTLPPPRMTQCSPVPSTGPQEPAVVTIGAGDTGELLEKQSSQIIHINEKQPRRVPRSI